MEICCPPAAASTESFFVVEYRVYSLLVAGGPVVMKVLSWNCRGLGNAAAVRALLDVQRACNPEVMSLSETHLESYPWECLRKRLHMDQKFVCPGDGRKGGLILFWKKGNQSAASEPRPDVYRRDSGRLK